MPISSQFLLRTSIFLTCNVCMENTPRTVQFLPMPTETSGTPVAVNRLKRSLGLWDLIIIGIVIVQPMAPMGIYGVISNKAVATLSPPSSSRWSPCSYRDQLRSHGRVYPSAGSAYTYVGQEIHPALGYITGWSMVMDYILNPLICTAFCSQGSR